MEMKEISDFEVREKTMQYINSCVVNELIEQHKEDIPGFDEQSYRHGQYDGFKAGLRWMQENMSSYMQPEMTKFFKSN